MKKVKYKFNPKKFIRNMLLVILFIILISIFANNILAYENYQYERFIVSNGDTLWSIAKQEQEKNPYYYNKDIREIIQDIKKTNNLNRTEIVVGQELKIKTF